jgi:N-methylhydantoinase B
VRAAERVGVEQLREATAAVLDYAERPYARLHRELEDGDATATRRARGARGRPRAALHATVDGDELTLDFDGSADQHDGNLNCPLAVTRSACLFAVRVLTDPTSRRAPAPTGRHGQAPEGSLLNARRPPRSRRQRRDLVARRRPRAARVRRALGQGR